MSQSRLWCFGNERRRTSEYLTGVSLHSHTNHSKESLHFIPDFAAKYPVLQRALERQCKKSKIAVDFERAYWTPPLTANLAYEVESGQIQNVVGLASLVSLTDHDSIAAPALLRALPGTRDIPIALEWTVPYGGAVFHLGVHNLPETRAVDITADLAAYTKQPVESMLTEILATLNAYPDVLIVFNHPLWDLGRVGPRYRQLVNDFLEQHGKFMHALEINGVRGWAENARVVELAERYDRPIISGGDRHGREPSATLNLTRAQNFPEFIAEVRYQQRSHLVMMPQYAEPRAVHVIRTLLDTIRSYPEYPVGSRRWDNRVFHPSIQSEDCAISTLWKAPPTFIELIFSALPLLENNLVLRAMNRLMKGNEYVNLEMRNDVTL